MRCAVALISAGLEACLGGSPLLSGGGSTRVESTPSGAEVFVMGERLGTTPIEVEDARIFPVEFPRELSNLYGKVVLRHPDCEDVERSVDLRATNEGLKVELVCADSAAARAPVHAGSVTSADRPPAPAGGDAQRPPAERLVQIEALRRDGLIGAAEALALRDRVLREVLDDRPAPEALRSLESLHAAGAVDDDEYRARRAAIINRL